MSQRLASLTPCWAQDTKFRSFVWKSSQEAIVPAQIISKIESLVAVCTLC